MSELETFVFYILIVLIVTFISKLAYSKRYRRNNKLFLLVAILIMAFVAGIRYDVGSDWYQYYHGPELVGGQGYLGAKNNYEIGYIIICKILYFLGFNGTALLFIYAFLTYLFFFMTVDRYADVISVPTTVFMYGCFYYLVTFNITRQALAITIAMYAISQLDVDYLKNEAGERKKLSEKIRHNIKYLIWCMVAFLFHHSGIISILALPICLLMRKRNAVRWIALGITVVVVANFRMFTQLAVRFTGIADFQWYFIGQFGKSGSWTKYILQYLPIAVMFWLSYKAIIKNQKIFDIYNLSLVGLIINSLSVVTNTQIERIGFSFLYFITIMTGFGFKNANKCHCFLNKRIKISSTFYTFYKAFICLFIVWTMWYIFFKSGAYEVVPYKTVFGK